LGPDRRQETNPAETSVRTADDESPSFRHQNLSKYSNDTSETRSANRPSKRSCWNWTAVDTSSG